MRAAVVSMVMSAVVIVSCGAPGLIGEANPTGTGATTHKSLDSTGGVVEISGAILTVPVGAIAAGTTFTVTSTTAAAPSEFSAFSPVYKFEPEGLVFEKPVRVELKPTVAGGRHLVVFWTKRGSATEFEALASSVDGAIVSAEVTHFSSGFVGSLDEPQDVGA